ncbi:hypothetical protein BJ165DRAFT_283755 [Panaeolus papilionaceus]|nr:hypothetical protein BJ165DRAFT_283755 [Panaeolus papilionaceus]
MLLRSPTLASAYALYFLICFYCLQLVIAQAPPPPGTPPPQSTVGGTDDSQHLLCTPFGACEPCPADALHQPYCQPFGNRRLLHCVNSTHTDDSAEPTDSPSAPSHTDDKHDPGEVLAWESCGRIVPQERADFFEFIACNVVFAAVALVVLFFRSRRREAQQARQLAARIGLNWGNGGTTTGGSTR